MLLPARHRLAARPELAVEALAGETWIRPLTGSAPVRHVQATLLRGQRAPGALALLEVLREPAPTG